MSFHIFSRPIFIITISIYFYFLFLFLVFKASQWHLQIEPNYCVKHLKIFKKSKYERTFWNNWHEKHPKWQYREKISKCKDCQITLDNEIQNEIMTSMNNLKEQNTLMSSLQQKVSKTVVRNWNLLNNSLPSLYFLTQQQQ